MFIRRSTLRIQAIALGVFLTVSGAAEASGLAACVHHGHMDAGEVPADSPSHEPRPESPAGSSAATESSASSEPHAHGTASTSHPSTEPDSTEPAGSPSHDGHPDDACRLLCTVIGNSSPAEGLAATGSDLIRADTGAAAHAPADPLALKPTEHRYFLPYSLAPPTISA